MKILKNSLINLLGVIIPALIIMPVFGYFSRHLTTEEFGIFSISFSILGYSSLFDAGLSRSVVRLLTIKDKLNLTDGEILGTAVTVVTLIGIILLCTIYMNAGSLVFILNISKDLKEVSVNAFKILALAIPFMLINLVIVARLESSERFNLFNTIKILSAIISVLPIIIFPWFMDSFIGAITGIVVGRVLSLIVSIICIGELNLFFKFRFTHLALKKLFEFGGWISISNIISPIMVYFDRFILSALLGAEKVAYYTLPSELVTRINLFPSALTRAAFPHLSRINDSHSENYQEALSRVKRYLYLFTFTVVPLMMLCSHLIIYYWLGEKFVAISANILIIMLSGYLFNSLSQLPVLYLQSIGITRAIAILHMCEVIPYLILLYFMINRWGLYGAASAWSIRVIIDNLMLNLIAKYYKNINRIKYKLTQ
ncbi:flippase [Pantoea sp. FN0307]|uniref:flippase n=1 Tax=Pantoea sp. FN0307 TaxID=3418560 RepID=UPI003CEB6E2F